MAKTDLPIEPEFNRHVPPLPTGLSNIADDTEDSPEVQDLDPEDSDTLNLIENEDGSVTVKGDSDDEEHEGKFFDNLAETLPDSDLRRMAADLLDLIDRDQQARARRDEQYAEGIKRTGLGDEAPGGADFEGASKAVHPVMAEGCIDFAARAMKEIFPAAGPVKAQIIGESDDEKVSKAERKTTYMNWQFTKQIREYRAELEQLLTQLPLGGSQYLKIWRDDQRERPRTEFVSIDDIFLPFSVSDFYSAHRLTHRQRITRSVFESRIRSGLYRDIDNKGDPALANQNESESSQATSTIEGKDELSYNEDGLRTIYEIYVNYEVDDHLASEDEAPYIITVDEASSEVLAVYRNWDEEDETPCPEKLDWLVEFKFIPWRGAYGIGLPHIIGSLSGALTGALRALLDSAHINNMPGALKMKGMRTSGQTLEVSPTNITDIEGPTGIDDIRKLIMPMPFNPPSQVLFQLLDWCTAQAKGVVSTAEEKISDASNNMPVGTTLALIEQGSVVFSAIHSRMHASQAKVMEILHRINRDNLEDEETIEELGSLVVKREDFQGPIDVIPVSDPNIFSEAQRYAQLQAVQQLAAQSPDLYNMAELNKRALKLLKFPDSDGVLNAPPEPKKLDPTSENAVAASGKQQLKVYPEQDHHTHLMSHLHFALSPIFCANPLMAMPALPALISHCKDHLIEFYKQHTKAATAAVATVTQQGGDVEKTQLMGQAIADEQMAKDLAPVMQMLQQAQQAAQQFSPPPPVPPELQIAQAQIAAQQATAQAKQQGADQLSQAKLSAEQQKQQSEQQIAAAELKLEQQKQQQEFTLKQQQAQADAQAEKLGMMLEQQKNDLANKLESLTAAQSFEAERQELLLKANTDKVLQQMQSQQDLAMEQLRLKSEQEISIIKSMADAALAQQQSQGQVDLGELFKTIQQVLHKVQNKPTRKLVYSDGGVLLGVQETDDQGQATFRKAGRDNSGNLINLSD